MPIRAELMAELLGLPENERADLAAALLASLEDDQAEEGVAEAWDAEIERRLQDDDDGKAEWIDGAEVMREIRAILAAHRR